MYDTESFEIELNHCDSIEQLKKEIIPLLSSQRVLWTQKIEEMLSVKAIGSCKKLATLCKVSDTTVRKWRKGSLPQSRDMYIRIGFAAGYNLDEMNLFLKRYGKCSQLYIKSLEDCVCIFILKSKELTHSYETYLQILNMIKIKIQEKFDNNKACKEFYETSDVYNNFSFVKNVDELISFIQKNTSIFVDAYAKLYSYVIAFLKINLEMTPKINENERKISFHEMSRESHWSSSLVHCISEIKNKRWFPIRHKLISLGIHLNMDVDQINQMLEYAHMEGLYVKNPIEASIIWAINEMRLSTEEDIIIANGSSDLYDFVRNILLQLDLSDDEYILNEF